MIVAIRATLQPWQTCHVVSDAEVAEPIGRALAAPVRGKGGAKFAALRGG
jgi:hypothetical protein